MPSALIWARKRLQISKLFSRNTATLPPLFDTEYDAV
jgi:hypothetical protein